MTDEVDARLASLMAAASPEKKEYMRRRMEQMQTAEGLDAAFAEIALRLGVDAQKLRDAARSPQSTEVMKQVLNADPKSMAALSPVLAAIDSHADEVYEAHARPEYTIMDGIKVVNLTSDAGRALNGMTGVVRKPLKQGRHEIYISGLGENKLLKPENLRLHLPRRPTLPLATEGAVTRLMTLLEEGDMKKDAEFAGIMNVLRAEHDYKSFSRLAAHAAKIVDAVRCWRDLRTDSVEDMYVHGNPDNSTNAMIRGRSEHDKQEQSRYYQRAHWGVLLLGALMHIDTVRKKVQCSDVVELLSDMCRSPCYHPYALETELQLASSLLNIPSTRSEARQVLTVSRFFGLGYGFNSSARTPQQRAGPVYSRLTELLGAVDKTTFTAECARRLLRWGTAYVHSEAKIRSMIRDVREAVAQHHAEDAEMGHSDAACAAENCFRFAGVPDSDGRVWTFQKCARCRLAVYCSRECQKWDWKHGGHKIDCKPMQTWPCAGSE